MRAFQTSRSDTHRRGGDQRTPQWSTAWRRTAAAVAVAAGLGALPTAQAESLVSLLQAAKSYDAGYLGTKANLEATRYQVEASYALERPNLGAQAELSRYRYDAAGVVTDAERRQAADQGITLNENARDIGSTNKRLSVAGKYPLYNGVNQGTISQAELKLKAAEIDLQNAEMDLSARLATAYFDLLSTQGNLTLAQANKKAMAELLAAAKRSFEVGNATITDTREAQARHDLAEAQEIAAINDMQAKQIALDQLVGRRDVKPNPLSAGASMDKLLGGSIDDWANQSINSPAIAKAKMALEGVKIELDKAKAGHMPTADLTGNITRTWSDASNSTYRVNSGTGTVYQAGVQVNVPLYAGGGIESRVQEMTKSLVKAENDRDNAIRTVDLTTRRTYIAVQSGLAQVKALDTATNSAKVALEATQLGFRVGVRINKDVLDAQTLVANTAKDLAKARYEVLSGSVRLRQAAGTLNQETLEELDRMLAPQ
jgi:outer membrane protein